MVAYNYPPNTRIAPKKPIKAEDIQFIRDIGLAIAEGADGAPKIADKLLTGVSIGGDITFSLLDDYSGLRCWIAAEETGTISLKYSDDGGVSFSSGVNVFQQGTGEVGYITLFVDFATGDYHVVGGPNAIATNGTVGVITGTLSGASTAITDIRLSMSGSQVVAVEAQPQGGQTTS